MLEKSYQPQDVETRLYKAWEDSGAFKGGRTERVEAGAEPYCIVIPPPNVTGSLHMGHALNNTLQDILIRFERMRGRDVLWQPGMDHAGIATQMVVERQLEAEGKQRRRDMGREAFVERVWEWKNESGGTILEQQRRLGASCDWSRERFTLDEGLSAAVLKVFVQLHKEGLIYRDKRLVNWHPGLQTAVSDLEVENIETPGSMWHFTYPIEGEEGRTITVATTRPETMLGDTGVAVHPDDERYKDLIGKFVILPLVGRRIPIVADEYADPELGSGAVKITPAHDFNDFEVGKRNDLEMINILTETAHLNDNVPEAYRGMERFAARKQVLVDMEAAGHLAKVEDHTLMVPYDEKSKMVVIEPYLTDQWYVDAKTLAQPAIEAVKSGKTKFVPENWDKTYFEWMNNIQPWCISRQLWWGHRIPAWYGPDRKIFVGVSEEDAQEQATAHYGKPVELERDPDVLDTWFSSALWPFSTLGWPEKTPELDRYYQTDVLMTGFDIIFFWVARMMMMGLHFMDEVPFHTVYIHALVRDEKGAKMSKSKGNVINPLDLVEEYGADALRFTLTAMAAQGRDIKLSTSRVEGYRNFGTKLWNAARFCEMNECVRVEGFDPSTVKLTVNKAIISKVAQAVADVTESIEAYRFNETANVLYRFIWNVFCDWHLEFIKPIFFGEDEVAIAETRATSAWVLDQILLMLHPVMPFETEELWQETGKVGAPRDGMLMLAQWPVYTGLVDEVAEQEMDWVVRFITEIRSVRSEMNVPAGNKIPLLMSGASDDSKRRLDTHLNLLQRLARLTEVTLHEGAAPEGCVQTVLDEATLLMPLAGAIDLDAEIARLNKDVGLIKGDIAKLSGKLSNEKFVAKAPAAVVAEERVKLVDAQEKLVKQEDALVRMKKLVG